MEDLRKKASDVSFRKVPIDRLYEFIDLSELLMLLLMVVVETTMRMVMRWLWQNSVTAKQLMQFNPTTK